MGNVSNSSEPKALGAPETPEHLAQEQFGKELWAKLLASKGESEGELVATLWSDDLVTIIQRESYGGGTLLVGPDLTVLFFGSALKMSKAAAAYLNGRRTPIDNF